MGKQLLLLDFGSTYTKGTLVDAKREALLAQVSAETAVKTSIMASYEAIRQQLVKSLGNEALAIQDTYIASSAFGGFKMVAIGLTQSLTAKAAVNVALGSGTRILKTYAYQISPLDVLEIQKLEPDVVLLTGGTEGGNTAFITAAAEKLQALPAEIPLVVAGNTEAYPKISAQFAGGRERVIFAENILPKTNFLRPDKTRQILRQIFFDKIISAKGLGELKHLSPHPILPTPLSVLEAAELLSQGTEKEAGIGPTCIIDIGGATTDIHSVIENHHHQANRIQLGLPEPVVKRTVEGDLGMRYSSQSLLMNCGVAAFQEKDPSLEALTIERRCHELEEHPESLPSNAWEQQFDQTLARIACQEAMQRHAGTESYVKEGSEGTYYWQGKDLRGIQNVIGTGGVIVHSPTPLNILKEATAPHRSAAGTFLFPEQPAFYRDHAYLLSAMGLLAKDYPALALRIAKAHLEKL